MPKTKRRKISDKGINMIAQFEGCELKAYQCPAGKWTIGYGHTKNVNPGDRLSSEAEAKKLLKKDLAIYEGYVNECVENGKIGFLLNQNQFDALTSFAYNCGKSNLQQLVTGRNAETIAQKILLYHKGGGQVLNGLVKRRKAEQELFLS